MYKWKHPITARKKASLEDLQSLPKLKLKKSKKVHPGIASYAQNLGAVGRDHLQSLVAVALREVPGHKITETPIYLMATAGVRFLPDAQQTALLHSACSYLQSSTDFFLPICSEHIKVISGKTEGLYGWIATNYLLGALDRPAENNHGKGHHTFGFLDMGGASAQIAFAPNATEAERHANDLQLIRLRRLDGSMEEHKIFTATWLGFGANKARSRYVENLLESYGDSSKVIPDPCLPKGLQKPVELPIGQDPRNPRSLMGAGSFQECLKRTYPLLEKDTPCQDHPCLLGGQHVPAIDFQVNHFVGVSEYWHATHGVFGQEKKAYDLVTYQRKVTEFCNEDWENIQKDITRRKKSHDEKVQAAGEACFKASWLLNILYEGIGIPRLGLESTLEASHNGTLDGPGGTSRNHPDPFQPINTVHGVEVTWTLGKMLLYAAGQVPPGTSTLPVGFGSNVASATSSDFEYAGSTPLTVPDDEDGEADVPGSFFRNPLSHLFGLLLVLSLVACLLRKPDRRHKIFSLLSWTRRSSGRKARRRIGLLNRLFSRQSSSYERVLEECEAAEFELDDACDLDRPGGIDIPRRSRQNDANMLKARGERLGDAKQPSVMDRTGLVVRTESRERLTTNLQMLNAGRKSRTGSPTRLKSPLMVPLQDPPGA